MLHTFNVSYTILLKKGHRHSFVVFIVELCYIFATLSYIKIGVPPKMGSVPIK